jgi:hypothetical protein
LDILLPGSFQRPLSGQDDISSELFIYATREVQLHRVDTTFAIDPSTARSDAVEQTTEMVVAA